jgi:hypothetical protein
MRNREDNDEKESEGILIEKVCGLRKVVGSFN